MKKIITYILITGWLFAFNACTEDFEDMNKDPFNPTTTTISPVFNKIMSSLLLGWQEQAGLHNTWYYYHSQQAGRFGMSGYLLDASLNDMWSSYYRTLADYRLLEQLFTSYDGELSLINVQAMAKTAMAHKTLKMIEAFGDMPYFDAGRGSNGADYFRVAYDDDVDIYKACLEDLKWASENFTPYTDDIFSAGSYDPILGNDIDLWEKWANSLILRHALRIYDVEQTFAGDMITYAISKPVLEQGENITINPAELGITLESRGWSFWSENMIRMGTAMWESMSADNSTDGSGIFDPRTYVFFETNNAGEWVPYPQNPGASDVEGVGLVYKTARDADYWNKGVDNLYSPFNYWLVRDINDIPEFLQLASEVYFLKAEAYAKGAGVAQSMSMAQAAYEEGIRTSIEYWYSIVDLCSIWIINVPTEPLPAEVDAFIANPAVVWDNGTALELIYTQRWIDAFRMPWEGFHLWNYTNMTPRDVSGSYTASDYDMYRIHYPVSEQQYNYDNWSATPFGGANDTEDMKLFWHK